MADEISQVVELECRGVYYLVKATKETIGYIVRAAKAMAEHHEKKKLEAPGESDWNKILKVSEGMPNVIEMPKEMFERNVKLSDGSMTSFFEWYCSENNLRFCMLPDMNPYDDYVPVGVPAQDTAFHQEQVKAVLNKRVKMEEEKAKEYDEKIEEAKNKINDADTPEKKEAAKKELEGLLKAKEQNLVLLEETKEKEKSGGVLSFEEYLRNGLGTSFEKDPEMALKSGGITGEYLPKDCIYPIRDSGLVPESGEIYYTQTTKDHKMYSIRRRFSQDDNGVVYSTYYATNPDQPDKVQIFSDKNMSTEEFEKELPKILKESGMVLNQAVVPVGTKERLQEYIVEMERNFKQAPDDGKKIEEALFGATREVKDQILEDERKQSFDLSQMIQLEVPDEDIVLSDEYGISLAIKDGLIKNVNLHLDEAQGKMTVLLDPKETYRMDREDGKEVTISGVDIKEMFSKEASETVLKETRRMR